MLRMERSIRMITSWTKPICVKKKLRNDQGEFVTQRELGSCYHVSRCLNPVCNTFWQRDVNACRNIMEVFIYQVFGLPRPKYLERETISEKVLISAANLEEVVLGDTGVVSV